MLNIKAGDLVRYKRWESNDYPEKKMGVVLELSMQDPRYPDEWEVLVYWNSPHVSLGSKWWEYCTELEVVNESR